MDHASGVPDLSFHLLDEITDGFSPDRILGIGSFGKVYKGVHKNGKKIAVKVLHDMIALDEKQFINEYNNLTKLQHHNIVRLVGYCQENRKEYINYEGRLVLAEEIKRVLCFEYLPNGSLDKYLFDEHHGQDWKTRYVIIKGICNGLKYLHEDLEAPMYHLDLKPANILLDENMEPKIADFGLSRLFGEEKTRTTTSSIGTLGYLPPEYIERSIISNKLDIFSLGVIVIKIVTGRSGYSKCFEMPSQQFIQLVQNNWRNRLQKATDIEEVKSCIEIALRCLEVDRRSRPTIGEIVHKLSETETVIHNLFTQLPHWLRNDPVALDNSKNVPVSNNKQQGNNSGSSMQQASPVLAIVIDSKKCIPFGVSLPELRRGGLAPLSKLTASSRTHFKKGSSRTRSKKFIVAAIVCLSETSNIRVQQAVMKAVTVRNRGNDVNEKRHPPKLADEVCCLETEGISKDRTFHISKGSATAESEFLWKLRKYVLLLATLAATVTYSTGLSSPGGFWPDNVDGGVLLAGDPVLRVTYPRRYKAFFYCNATAFVASLVIVTLLLVRSLCHRLRWLRALQAAMMLDQFCLMGAYAVGSCRDEAMSAYVFVLVALVASYTSAQVLALFAPSAREGDMDTPDHKVERVHKHLLIFVTLVATITYQAGLRTPGGFWPGSQADDHLAGDLLLRVHNPSRFMVFFYSNTTAFVASLVVVMLLMSNTVTGHRFRSWVLWVSTAAAMVGLMGSFASGIVWSNYVVALVAALIFYIALQALVYFCEPVKNLIQDAQVALERHIRETGVAISAASAKQSIRARQWRCVPDSQEVADASATARDSCGQRHIPSRTEPARRLLAERCRRWSPPLPRRRPDSPHHISPAIPGLLLLQHHRLHHVSGHPHPPPEQHIQKPGAQVRRVADRHDPGGFVLPHQRLRRRELPAGVRIRVCLAARCSGVPLRRHPCRAFHVTSVPGLCCMAPRVEGEDGTMRARLAQGGVRAPRGGRGARTGKEAQASAAPRDSRGEPHLPSRHEPAGRLLAREQARPPCRRRPGAQRQLPAPLPGVLLLQRDGLRRVPRHHHATGDQEDLDERGMVPRAAELRDP